MPIPKLVITAALMAVQVGLSMTRKIEGPRLDNLSVSLADYGTPLPRIFGQRRLMGQIFWAADLREEKKESKTKGGKQTQYTYYGDWAVAICDQDGHDLTAFDDIVKVWFDKQLVFDKTTNKIESIGAVFGDDAAIKLHAGHNYRIYKGTTDQMPDQRIEAWCEDKYGPDTCPAYRLTGYIVFQNIPLTYVGNRIPQVEVEVVKNPTPVYPFTTIVGGGMGYLSPSGAWMVAGGAGNIFPGFQVIDVPTLTIVAENWDVVTGTNHKAVNDDGSFYVGSYAGKCSLIDISGSVFPVAGPTSGVWNTPLGLRGTDGIGFGYMHIPNADFTTTAVPLTFHPDWYFTDYDDPTVGWACGQKRTAAGGLSSTTGIGLYNLATGTEYTIPTSDNATVFGMDNGQGEFCLRQGNNLYTIDKATLSIVLGPVVTSGPSALSWQPFEPAAAGDPDIWIDWSRYDTHTLEVLQTADPGNWITGPGVSSQIGMYDKVNNAMFGANAVLISDLTDFFLDRISGGQSTLKEVVDAVSRWCGVTGQDTTQLTQIVRGYSVTQGAGKDMLSPMLDIYDVDAGNHDFGIKFVNRGSAPAGAALLTQDFAIPDKGSKRYITKIAQAADLPLALTFNFADLTIDDQPNNVRTYRSNTSVRTTQEKTIDLTTYEDTPSGAQQKGDRYMRRLWNERERTTLALTYQNIILEPADVRNISLDGHVRSVRVDKLTVRKNHIELEVIRDTAAVAVLNNATGPNMDGNVPDTIIVTPPTKGFVLDMPNLNDSEASIKPLLHVAASAYTADALWPGAIVYDGSDGTFDSQLTTISASNEAHWGTCINALGDANPNLIDWGNTLNLSMFVGTLTASTRAAVDADPSLNLLLVGRELLQFINCTLNGDGTYTLSGFKRGRRGTEWATGSHSAGEAVIVTSKMQTVELATDDIGVSKAYKVQTYGRGESLTAAIPLTFSAASLKPYAPARLKWSFDGTDLQGTITRRTRLGGNWNGGSIIPMVESTEAYEVDIYNGATFKRTISVSGTNVFTYTAAMAAEDGISLPARPTAKVYQLSAVVGRGYELAA